MGKKLDKVFYLLSNEVRHHVKLALVRQSDYENGFAQGFSEALRIVQEIREK
jgi:RNAse (barnase) inhibitor barstar